MLVFVMDKNGRMGHPTRKCGMIRRKLKQGKAKIVHRFQDTIVVKIFDLVIDEDKTVDCKFILGIDPGYSNIGYYVIKVVDGKVYDILSGELKTRTEKIKGLLLGRKMYRNGRRRHRRKRVQRLHGSVKFRHPRWKNRKKHQFQPTHIHLIQTHLNLIKKIHSIVNFDEINIEYFKYDSQKALNPDIKGTQYQRGIQYGFANTNAYVLDRDGYKCQSCGETDIGLKAHHIVERTDNGSDRPENLVTVCYRCHHEIHIGKRKCPVGLVGNNTRFRDSGVLNSCMPALLQLLQASNFVVRKTFGSATKVIREYLDIPKTHRTDAFCIAIEQLGEDMLFDESTGNIINYQQFRRHNRKFVNRFEDRKYYISGIRIVQARNRKRRSGQDKKDDFSLEDYRQITFNGYQENLVAKAGGTIMNNPHTYVPDKRSGMKFRVGNQYKFKKKIRTIIGTGNIQQRVFYEKIEKTRLFDTFTQIRKHGEHLLCNSGIVPV